jgi:hypothetical protein
VVLAVDVVLADVVVVAGALVVVELLVVELLLPHPTTSVAHSSASASDADRLPIICPPLVSQNLRSRPSHRPASALG